MKPTYRQMETTFTLRRDELDAEFLETLKLLFKNSRELTLTVSTAEDFGLTQPETRDAYFARLAKAAENLSSAEGRVIMPLPPLSSRARASAARDLSLATEKPPRSAALRCRLKAGMTEKNR